jgi:hypothetical protein
MTTREKRKKKREKRKEKREKNYVSYVPMCSQKNYVFPQKNVQKTD